MTPSEIETYCRRVTRKESDDFFASAEIIDNYLYDACMQVSMLIPCIESKTTTASVASTQNYDIPTTAAGIQRVEYEGKKLQWIDKRDYDTLTYSNSISTTTGTPSQYYVFNNDIWLWPIPGTDADDIDIYTWDYHPAITVSSTLSIPTYWHILLTDYVIAQMYLKDKDDRAMTYLQKWETNKLRMKDEWMRKSRGDRFAIVKDEDAIASTDWGMI